MTRNLLEEIWEHAQEGLPLDVEETQKVVIRAAFFAGIAGVFTALDFAADDVERRLVIGLIKKGLESFREECAVAAQAEKIMMEASVGPTKKVL